VGKDDVELVINNARRYNKKDTSVHRSAVRVQEGAEPILAELESLDMPDSQESLYTSHIASLLEPDIVEQLFDYHYDPEPPKPLKLVLLKKGKRVSTPTKKRSASEAGLDDVGRSSSRLRGEAAKLGIESDAAETPIVSTRVNPREAARLRAEAAAQSEAGTPARATKRDKGKGKAKEPEEEAAKEPRPLEVVDIGKRDTFKMFETGCALPPRWHLCGGADARRC